MSPKKQSSRNPPGVLCFSLDRSGSINKRARYEPKRRKEVADVRARGACLRCQLMRMACSGGRPCFRCAEATISVQASSYLWLRSCVPSALADLKRFFQADLPIKNGKIEGMLSKNNHLMLSLVYLEFDDQVEWDLAALSKTLALLMSQNDRVPTMSKVGILSSLRFQQLLSPLISSKLGSYFRLMMHTSSIIYNLGPQDFYCGIPLADFYALRCQAGANVLMGLENLLRPAELANATPDKLQAIFLLLFGTTLAVLYNERLEDETANMLPLHDRTQRVSAREFFQLQEQLIRVLAHRVVDLADRLALLESGVSKQLLVDSAKQQWHLPAAFVWQDSLVPFDPASINGDPPPSRPTILSSLCGGQLDGLEKDCNFYSFENPSSLSGKHYGLFSRPPIVPIFVPTAPVIAGPDTGPDSKLAPAHNTPTCWKCGNLLQNGVPDTLCDACAFFDWELFDSEATNFSAASPLLQTNSCQPTNKSGELEPSSQAASEFGHEIFTGFRSLISSGDSLQHHVPSGSTFQDYDQDVRGIIPQSLVTDGVQNKTKSRQSHPGELRGLYCSYCMAQRSASSVLVCTCGRLFDDAHYYPETDSTKNKPTQSNSPMWRVGNNSTEQSSGYVRYKTNDIKCYTSSDRVEPRFSTLRDKFSVFRAFLV